ncbi:SpoIIE family protein phosphatase [Herpetosiphon giganteus]|uniref:SpoIIE family protein phosphatase n=1 Tax=Herpetosiphon giganteus TaxID=2029754 RepID=UPI00195B896E|nr:SpoIIE family protein phosphatase [Herpetosiphon giganteus]MBM7841626.1 serine/threonine protein phosphatase PrpC [Herpetosiphon giganteus]
MRLNWSVQTRSKYGQSVSGDGYAVIENPNSTLIAVIDGLGGGAEAAKPTKLALDELHQHSTRPLKELIERCHKALHGTRGAVIGLLRLEFDHLRASYIGVGNIGIHVISDRVIKPISKNGILGHNQLPSLLEMTYTFNIGDIFVLYSDGISTRMITDSALHHAIENPESLALGLMERYGKTTDDVTILIAQTQ